MLLHSFHAKGRRTIPRHCHGDHTVQRCWEGIDQRGWFVADTHQEIHQHKFPYIKFLLFFHLVPDNWLNYWLGFPQSKRGFEFGHDKHIPIELLRVNGRGVRCVGAVGHRIRRHRTRKRFLRVGEIPP